jgi:tetratricopeptide (TPR) repeat protein
LDKNKIIETAGKLVAKGAYDKAIKEYQRILDVDSRDVRTLQKMGELYQKKNEPKQASFYFMRVAESYASDGFFLKAVALYKQVLKLDPSLVEVNLKLAELHQQLHLLGEALGHYQATIGYFEQQGNWASAIEVLEKMATLDVQNVTIRAKLAELYARQNKQAESLKMFEGAASAFREQGRLDEYARVVERILTLAPERVDLARELAQIYLSEGEPKRALNKLQLCFKANAKDTDTLRMMAMAFEGLGQLPKVLSVYKELVRIYMEQENAAAAEQVWAHLAQLAPSDPDVRQHYAAIAPAKLSSAHFSAMPHQTGSWKRVSTPSPEEENLGRILTETDVYIKYGLFEKALDHLKRIFQADPENIDAHEKAYQIYVESNNPGLAEEQLLNVLRLHTRLGDSKRAQFFLAKMLEENASHPEVPTFVAVLGRGMEVSPALLDMEGGGTPSAGLALGEDLGVESMLATESVAEVLEASLPEAVHSPSFPVGKAPEIPKFVAAPEGSTWATGSQTPLIGSVELGAEECEEAEFFISQGIIEEARIILNAVLAVRPGHARATTLLAKLESAKTTVPSLSPALLDLPPDASVPPGASAPMEDDDFVIMDEEPPAPVEEFQYSVDDVFSEFKKGLKQVVQGGDVETHYDLGIAYKEMGLMDDALAEFKQAFQGCQGTKKELDCLTMMALLFSEKQEWSEAIRAYELAISQVALAPESELPLRYELAVLLEAIGRQEDARAHYSQLLAKQPGFRDVEQRLGGLGGPVVLKESSGDKPKSTISRKVGYV